MPDNHHHFLHSGFTYEIFLGYSAILPTNS